MILNLIFGSFALLSFALTLWQWLVSRRFPLHQRVAESQWPPTPGSGRPEPPQASSPQPTPLAPHPSVTLLKPLKGCDSSTEDCLRSWFTQQYSGATQILFGVAAADDPVCRIVRKLLQEFPAKDAQLVVCNAVPGANAKVAKLAELERLAKHDLLVISDADVRVPPDLLANVVVPLYRMGKGSGVRTPQTDGSRFVPLNPSPALKGTLSPSGGERDGVRGPSVEPRSMGGKFPAVILRLAGIYGPGRGYWFKQYLKDEARIEGSGARILNMIHRDDVAGAIIAALKSGRPGEVYNVVDDEPVTQFHFFQWLSGPLGKELPPSVPEDPEAVRKRGVTNKKVSNRRLKMELGYQFKYPTFRQGYTAEILRLDRAGELDGKKFS